MDIQQNRNGFPASRMMRSDSTIPQPRSPRIGDLGAQEIKLIGLPRYLAEQLAFQPQFSEVCFKYWVDTPDFDQIFNSNNLVILDPTLRTAKANQLLTLAAENQTRILLISQTILAYSLSLSIAHNQSGYLTYQTSLPLLTEQISNLIKNHKAQVWSPEAYDLLIQTKHGYELKDDFLCSSLTGRQLEIVVNLAKGKSAKEIAHTLHISQKSVDSHKYRIMKKLNVHDRVKLCRLAIREGLIEA